MVYIYGLELVQILLSQLQVLRLPKATMLVTLELAAFDTCYFQEVVLFSGCKNMFHKVCWTELFLQNK